MRKELSGESQRHICQPHAPPTCFPWARELWGAKLSAPASTECTPLVPPLPAATPADVEVEYLAGPCAAPPPPHPHLAVPMRCLPSGPGPPRNHRPSPPHTHTHTWQCPKLHFTTAPCERRQRSHSAPYRSALIAPQYCTASSTLPGRTAVSGCHRPHTWGGGAAGVRMKAVPTLHRPPASGLPALADLLSSSASPPPFPCHSPHAPTPLCRWSA